MSEQWESLVNSEAVKTLRAKAYCEGVIIEIGEIDLDSDCPDDDEDIVTCDGIGGYYG